MGLADDLWKLQELHRNGSLTDDEYAQAKAALLAQGESGDPDQMEPLARQVDKVARWQAVQDIDREWAVESQKYLLRASMPITMGGGVYSYVPTKGHATMYLGCAIACFIGTLFVTAILATQAPGERLWQAALLFGLPLFAIFLAMARYKSYKATKYEQAHAAYQRRRADAQGSVDPVEASPMASYILGLLTSRLGRVPVDLAAKLAETRDQNVLQGWAILAGQAPTLDAFRKEAGL